MIKNYSKYLYSTIFILFILTSYNCQDKPPEVKVNNLSHSNLNVYFRLADCSCPSFTLSDIPPATITPYHELTKNKYSIKLAVLDNEVGNEIVLKPEENKQYQLNIDTAYNCRMDTFDR